MPTDDLETYAGMIDVAQRKLKAAQTAMGRDFAELVEAASWTWLRHRFDVAEVVAYLSKAGLNPGFVEKLHARADQTRLAKRPRGRPAKKTPPADTPALG